MNRHRRLGFTLIELMIVVVILSIIAAIGIPNMMRSRLSAQEASAIATMRTISSAQAAAQAQVLFPDPTTKIGLYGSFVEFDGLIAPKPLDSAITTPPHVKSGYQFSLTFVGQTKDNPSYQAYADPTMANVTSRRFFMDPSGVVRYTIDGSQPSVTSPSL